MLTIEDAFAEQGKQEPREDVRQCLGEISLLAFIGPSAAGKNFLMEQTELPQVGTVTSRAPRSTDNKSLYTYMSNEEMLEGIEKGDFVQYGIALPDRIYASRLEDYSKDKPNVADIYFDAVHPLRSAGFKSVKTVSILTPDKGQYHSQLMLNLEGQSVHSAHERLSKDLAALRSISANIWADTRNNLIILNRINNAEENIVEKNVDRIRDFAYDKPQEWQDKEELLTAIDSMRRVIESVRTRLVGQ